MMITYKTTREDIVAFYTCHCQASAYERQLKKTLRIRPARAWFGIFVAFGMFNLFAFYVYRLPVYFKISVWLAGTALAGAALWQLFFPLFYRYYRELRLRTLYGSNDEDYYETGSVTLGESGLECEITSKKIRVSARYSEIYNFIRHKRGVYICLDVGMVIVIPDSAFVNAEQRERFAGRIERNLCLTERVGECLPFQEDEYQSGRPVVARWTMTGTEYLACLDFWVNQVRESAAVRRLRVYAAPVFCLIVHLSGAVCFYRFSLYHQDNMYLYYVDAGMTIYFLAGGIIGFFLTRRRSLKAMEERQEDGSMQLLEEMSLYGEIEKKQLLLGSENLQISTANFHLSAPYSAVRRVERSDEYLYIQLPGGWGHVVPYTAFADREERREFLAVLKNKVGYLLQ